jgi:hypothetical protein
MVIRHQQCQHGLRLVVEAGETQAAEQGVFIAVMAVEGAPRDVRFNANLLNAGVFNTLFSEQLVSRVLDPGAYFEFALLSSPHWWCRCCCAHQYHLEGVLVLQSSCH